MTEIECTATVADGDERPNPLFTPPCACPRCAPEPVLEGRPDRDGLRLSGDPRRHRVRLVDLGETGRAVLG